MASTVQLNAAGLEPSHRCQLTLREAETLRIGRAAKDGCTVPWDLLISREHADICWRDGKLHATCLPAARNPILYQGKLTRELSVGPGEQFQIGQTTFEVVDFSDAGANGAPREEFGVDSDDALEERAYSASELKKVAFGNAQKQMELLADLPQMIASSHSDEDLGELLSQLLLNAIPNAEAAAATCFDVEALPQIGASLECFPKPKALRVATRPGYTGRFLPSRRLILATLRQQSSSIHIFGSDSGGEKFTVSDELGWAFCCPIRGESCRGWCMYVAGRGSERGGLVFSEQDLLGDLRFTELVAQFIGSVRQVRMLQDQKTQLSTFFSPKVIENLTRSDSLSSLAPAEREITVLFCDLRGFSRKSEKLQDDLLKLLKSVSEALGVMVNGIIRSDGAIADFQGDAALGFWGWPMELEEGPVPACIAALTIYDNFRRTIDQHDGLLEDFSVGIGISHGRAVAGRIGTLNQAKVGVFGPVVNLGSRLEGMTKQFGVPICIDETTADFAKRLLPTQAGRCRRLARVRPAGMHTPLNVFALLPPESEYPITTDQMIVDYEEALEAVAAGRWSDAIAKLNRLPETDGPREFLLKQMAAFNHEPPPNWDGVFSLQSK